jgi:hypothetical protein
MTPPEPVTVAELRALATEFNEDTTWNPSRDVRIIAALSAAADHIERLERVREVAIAALETQTLSMYPAFVILDAERVRSLRAALLAAASAARAGAWQDDEADVHTPAP